MRYVNTTIVGGRKVGGEYKKLKPPDPAVFTAKLDG